LGRKTCRHEKYGSVWWHFSKCCSHAPV